MRLRDVITNIVLFIFKVIISTFIFIYFINTLIPAIPETERNKLIATSFIQNPVILWKLSENSEKRGNYESSILYMESAIGLIEMNCGRDNYLERYKTRLEYLKKIK